MVADNRAARDVKPGESWAFADHRKQADLIADDALDDGFPYESMGSEVELRLSQTGWIAPTPFMVISLKELLAAVVAMYGYRGHWLLREIGRDNLRNPRFIEGLGLSYFLMLYQTAMKALPEDDLKRMGYRE
jgi:hypothetical protein